MSVDTQARPRRTKTAPWVSVDANTPGVTECDHRWVIVRVGDVVFSCYDPDELMVFCARCYSPRCGHTGDSDPCLEPRHHRNYHRGRYEWWVDADCAYHRWAYDHPDGRGAVPARPRRSAATAPRTSVRFPCRTGVAVTTHRGREYRKKRDRILRASDICWICGQPGADSIDHVIPIARGGTNDPSNLRPAHMHPCNRAKGDKDHAAIVRRSGSLG